MLLYSWEDKEFLNSKEARAIRIVSELLEPEQRLKKYNIDKAIVFFGSARIIPTELAESELKEARKVKNNTNNITVAKNKLEISKYYELATELSKKLSLWAKKLKTTSYNICTGGGPGIMEAANKGAFLAEHPSIGFNISLPFEQGANKYIHKDLVFNFKYFFMRKFWFTYLAKAFVAFPGGFGTLDELFELLTLIQTNKLECKLPVVLFGSEFYNSVSNLEIMEKYSLINKKDKELFLITDSIEEAFNYITQNI